MSKRGPIVILDDDEDDNIIYTEILRELKLNNPIKFFQTGDEIIRYLMSTPEKPFLIISDVNLPGMDGISLRARVNEIDYLKKKSIPFIFFTTTARPDAVDAAFKLMVQGYFEKPDNPAGLRHVLKLIIDYWALCKHPNVEE